MKRHLTPMWVTLWTDLCIRPLDVDRLTLDDALTVEVYADEARKRQQVAKARASRVRR